MKLRPSFALAALVAALAMPACDIRVNDKGVSLSERSGRAEDTWTRTYDVTKGGRFELETAFGGIEVLPSAGSSVEVVATRMVRARTDEAAAEILKQLEMQEEVSPERVSLKSSPLNRAASFQRVNVEYQVKVPAGLTVVIRNEFGNVNLNKVTGRFDVSVTNGRIAGEAVSGALEAQTVNGQVIMEMANVTDDIRITTVNGAVMLGLPADANATIEASAINGSVIVFDSLPVNAQTKERQRLLGRLGTGSGPRIELQATNGNVRLGGGKPPS
jgi:hypothetical protein